MTSKQRETETFLLKVEMKKTSYTIGGSKNSNKCEKLCRNRSMRKMPSKKQRKERKESTISKMKSEFVNRCMKWPLQRAST